MKDNTLMAIVSTTLILALGTCATTETYMRYKTKPPITQTVTNTIIESTTASTIALQLAVGQAEVVANFVKLQEQTIDTLVLLNKRVDQLESSLRQPPKTILEGYTNICISPDLIYTNTLKWVTNLHETH